MVGLVREAKLLLKKGVEGERVGGDGGEEKGYQLDEQGRASLSVPFGAPAKPVIPGCIVADTPSVRTKFCLVSRTGRDRLVLAA